MGIVGVDNLGDLGIIERADGCASRPSRYRQWTPRGGLVSSGFSISESTFNEGGKQFFHFHALPSSVRFQLSKERVW